jgi:diguanylate cyclase (GGDEF)-like protein
MHSEFLLALLMSVSSIPTSSNNIAVESYWRLSRIALGLAVALHIVFAVAFYSLQIESLVYLSVAAAAIYGGCIVLAKRRLRLLVTGLTLFSLAAYSFLLTRLVGLASGFQYYAWLVIPLVFFNTETRMQTKVVLATASIITCIAFTWLSPKTALITVAYPTLSNFFIFNVGCFLVANGLLAFTYAHAVGEASRQLHELATTDALTGLANRRRLLEIASHEIARSQRVYQPMSILLMDIDHFKSINDQFGHAGGDSVLLSLTHTLKKTIRSLDHIARWGGEEFLVLMPGVDLAVARAAAERIRLTLATTPLFTNDTELESLRLTVTVGVSEWQVIESIERCIERADVAMYRGKDNGRDRVEVHDHVETQAEDPRPIIMPRRLVRSATH